MGTGEPAAELTQVAAIAVDGSGGLWVGGREGIFISEDEGARGRRCRTSTSAM